MAEDFFSVANIAWFIDIFTGLKEEKKYEITNLNAVKFLHRFINWCFSIYFTYIKFEISNLSETKNFT